MIGRLRRRPTIRVSPTGDVTVLTGVTSPGSGNETAIAQIAADTLGCDSRPDTRHPGRHGRLPLGLRQLQLPEHHHGRICRPTKARWSSGTRCSTSRLEHARGRPRRSRAGRRAARPSGARRRARSSPSRRSPHRPTRHTHGRYMDDTEPALRDRHGTSGSATSTTSPRSRVASARTPRGPTAPPRRSSRSTPRPGYVKILRYVLVARRGEDHQPSARRCQPPRGDHAGNRRRDVRADRLRRGWASR